MLSQIRQLQHEISQIIMDKDQEIKLALCCLFAEGHLLIEDVPGVGKTTLVQSLAKLLGLNYARIQFTSDMLPADIIGNSIFDPDEKKFKFYSGPIFSQLILADELNRANPKTQSALLQAMEEGQISVDKETFNMPKPFIFIATQNPHIQIGTYPLPESQLDRFLMCLELKTASPTTEMKLFQGQDPRKKIPDLKPILSPDSVLEIQQETSRIHVSDILAKYIVSILNHARKKVDSKFSSISTRAGIDLSRATRAWAWLDGRKAALPEDVQAVIVHTLGHRMGGNEGIKHGMALAQQLIREVEVPV